MYKYFGETLGTWIALTLSFLSLAWHFWSERRKIRSEKPMVSLDIRDSMHPMKLTERVSENEMETRELIKEMHIVIIGKGHSTYVNNLKLEVRRFFRWQELRPATLDFILEIHMNSHIPNFGFSAFELKPGETRDLSVFQINPHGMRFIRAKIECSGHKFYKSKRVSCVRKDVKGIVVKNPYKESLGL
jgi:hypothetical protein